MENYENLLFVYGTLLRDTGNDMSNLLKQDAHFVDDAIYNGKLYMVEDYPGIIPSSNQSDKVDGEVYQLNEPDKLLQILDEYEECGKEFPTPTEYMREIQDIKLKNGKTCKAWVYIYKRSVENLEQIISGNFKEYINNNIIIQSSNYEDDVIYGFEKLTINMGKDYEGDVVSTVIRKKTDLKNDSAFLYIHGFNDYFFQYELADKIEDDGYRFYAVDLRKYGRSILLHQKPSNFRNIKEYYLCRR